MTISVVQTVPVTSNSTATATYVFTVTSTTAGNLLVVAIGCEGGTTQYTGMAVTDNTGGSWTTIASEITGTSASKSAFIARCLSANSGVTTVTVTPSGGSGGGYYSGAFNEVSGGPWLDDQHGVGTSTSTTALTITSAAANAGASDFVVAIIVVGANATNTGISNPTGNYTTSMVQQNDNTYSGAESNYRINTTVVTDSIAWTMTSGQSGSPGALASFQASGSGASTIPLAWYYV